MKTGKLNFLLAAVLIILAAVRSYSQGTPESRFGAQQCGWSAGALQEQTFQQLVNIGTGWGRATGSSDAIRGLIQSGGAYNFQKADSATHAAFRTGLNLIGQLTTQRQGNRNDVLATTTDLDDFKSYVRMVVERYDGDADFGVSPGEPLYPDCDLNGDATFTEAEKIEWGSSHRFHVWELMKEPLPPERATRPGQVGFTAAQVVTVLRAGWEAIKEADPDGVVLFGGLAPGPVGGLEAARTYLSAILAEGGMNYFDILGIGAFEDRPDLITDLYQGLLDSLGIRKTLWVVQVGTNGVGFGHNPFGGTLKRQSQYVVKSYVLSFAASAEKVFWGDFVTAIDQWVNDPASPAVWGNYSLLIARENLITKRPGYYTYGIMTSKLEGFSAIEAIGEDLYRFSFPAGSPVYVLWSDEGEEIVDLSPLINSSLAKVTHIIVDEGQTESETDTVFAATVQVNSSPIFVEELVSMGVEAHAKQNCVRNPGFALKQNYPNPFNPRTTIRFSLPQREHVTLKVFDELGREATTLVEEELGFGEHSVVFDAIGLASGVYLYRLWIGSFVVTRKMLVIR